MTLPAGGAPEARGARGARDAMDAMDDFDELEAPRSARPRRASPVAATVPAPPRWRRVVRRLAWLALSAALLTSPAWGRRALTHVAFFHLRAVEVRGLRYLGAAEVLQRLGVDTTTSVFADLGPLERRVAAHPQVRVVELSRRLPGTLVVNVVENLPVALVPTAQGMKAYDDVGRELPVDPSRVAVDLPVVAARDTAVLRLLAELRTQDPALYARVSDVRRVGRGELVVSITADSANTLSVPVRATADLSARRLEDIRPVEGDLVRRQARVAELDLRFRDQVIARLQ